jgi:hypothetical protein
MSKYKTELCKNYDLKGYCRFEENCFFAHGVEEIKKDEKRINYKTKKCRNFNYNGYCPYGNRCQFIHYEKRPINIFYTYLIYINNY